MTQPVDRIKVAMKRMADVVAKVRKEQSQPAL
jgi:hypothetical protein